MRVFGVALAPALHRFRGLRAADQLRLKDASA